MKLAPALQPRSVPREIEADHTAHSPRPLATLVMQEQIGRALRSALQTLLIVAVAACGGSDSAVNPPPCTISAVAISPTPATVAAGSSTTLRANVTSAHCGSLPTTWQSSATSIATVDTAGVVHGVALGTATITASVNGQSGSTVLTVGPGPILTVSSATPAANALNVGIGGSIKITFSEPINAATATAAKLARMGRRGGRRNDAVVGNVVTLTAASPLTDSIPSMGTVSPSVSSTAGNYLAASQASTFTTTLLDPAYYYDITNELQGPTKALDTARQRATRVLHCWPRRFLRPGLVRRPPYWPGRVL